MWEASGAWRAREYRLGQATVKIEPVHVYQINAPALEDFLQRFTNRLFRCAQELVRERGVQVIGQGME
jgi:hypothetical protein